MRWYLASSRYGGKSAGTRANRRPLCTGYARNRTKGILIRIPGRPTVLPDLKSQCSEHTMPSDENALRAQSPGEDSTRQFKANIRNAESLASERAAFANSEGGTIYPGVADDGGMPGLSREDVTRINQLISNAASQFVRSPLTVRKENVLLKNGKVVIVLTVPRGIDKALF